MEYKESTITEESQAIIMGKETISSIAFQTYDLSVWYFVYLICLEPKTHSWHN